MFRSRELSFKIIPVYPLFSNTYDGSNPKANNLNAAPRLLLDLGHFRGTPGHLFAGIEYQPWRNKFGIEGVDEDVAQVMLKWVF